MRYPQMPACRAGSLTVGALDGGLDLSLPPELIADNALSEADNVWWEAGALRHRPAFVSRATGETDMDATVRLTAVTLPHDGVEVVLLWRLARARLTLSGLYPDGRMVPLATGTTAATGCFLARGLPVHGAGLFVYLNDGTVQELSADHTTLTPLNEDDFYAPLLTVNGHPTAFITGISACTRFEGFNLLTPRFRCSYTPDGTNAYFSLPCGQITGTIVASFLTDQGRTVTVRLPEGQDTLYMNPSWFGQLIGAGEKLLLFVNRDMGRFFCAVEDSAGVWKAKASFGVSGENSITLTVQSAQYPSDNPVRHCTCATWFGGDRSGTTGGTRLFAAGGEDNRVFWSDLSRPLYFPEHNYAAVGDAARITALGRQGGLLVMFKAHEIFAAQYVANKVSADAVSAGTVVNVETYAATFPITPLHPAIGCDCPETLRLCHNRLVWATTDGAVYALCGSSQYGDGNVRRLSDPIAPLLENRKNALPDARAFLYRDRYMLCVGDQLLLTEAADKAGARWYRWTLPAATGTLLGAADGGVLLTARAGILTTFSLIPGTADHLAELGDRPVLCRFATKAFAPGTFAQRKAVPFLYVQFADAAGVLSCVYTTENGSVRAPAVSHGRFLRLTPRLAAARRFSFGAESQSGLALRGFSLRFRIRGIAP